MMEKDPRVRFFHARRFSLRSGSEPELSRASGDSGFVAHLAHSTHGATGWDWSFKLLRKGDGWTFATDGKVALFLDEPGQYVPAEARVGDVVAVKLPRARDNLVPHRFAVYGGQGGVVVGKGFIKFFVPVTYEATPGLVELFSGRMADQLRFSMVVSNSHLNFARADSAVIDVAASDEDGVVRILEVFVRNYPRGLVLRGVPYGTTPGALGLPRAEATGKADIADGYGWRRSREGVAAGLDVGLTHTARAPRP